MDKERSIPNRDPNRTGSASRMQLVTGIMLTAVLVVGGGLAYHDHLRKMERRAERVAGAPALHRAIALGKLSDARRLLKEGRDPNERDGRGNRPMHWVESASAVDLLVEYAADVNAVNSQGETPLFTVGNRGALAALISAGADVAHRDRLGETPMHEAKNLAAAKLFARHGVKFKTKDSAGNTPLHTAQHLKITKYLLTAGANLNGVNKAGETALFHARNADIAKFLIAAGLSPTQKSNSGKLPVHTARSPEIVRLLVAQGCDVDARDMFGNTPLMFATNSEIVGTLLDLGADVDAANTFGKTAVARAVEHPDIARQLAEAGASISTPSHYQAQSLVSEAAWGNRDRYIDALIEGGADFTGELIPLTGDIKLISKLLDAGAEPDFSRQYMNDLKRIDDLVAAGVDVTGPDVNGRTGLFQPGNIWSFDKLLELGADPTAVDYEGRTVLESVASTRYIPDGIRIVERLLQINAESTDLDALMGKVPITYVPLLLDYGAKPLTDFPLRQALHQRRNNEALVRSLLEAGSVLEAEKKDSIPFHLEYLSDEVIRLLVQHGNDQLFDGRNSNVLTRCHHLEKVKLLIEVGAPLDAKSGAGQAAIHTYWTMPALLEALLAAGADPDATDKAGDTALHRVLKSRRATTLTQRQKTAIGILIGAGANPDLRNNSNMSSRDLLPDGYQKLLQNNATPTGSRAPHPATS